MHTLKIGIHVELSFSYVNEDKNLLTHDQLVPLI